MSDERFNAIIFCPECDFEAEIESDKQKAGADLRCEGCGAFLGRWASATSHETAADGTTPA